MGIILPQINEITICSNNVKYYKELGYSIPYELKNGKEHVKRGTKIQVHTLDLTKGSHTMVKLDIVSSSDAFRLAMTEARIGIFYP